MRSVLSFPLSGHFCPQVPPEEETVLATKQDLLIISARKQITRQYLLTHIGTHRVKVLRYCESLEIS